MSITNSLMASIILHTFNIGKYVHTNTTTIHKYLYVYWLQSNTVNCYFIFLYNNRFIYAIEKHWNNLNN